MTTKVINELIEYKSGVQIVIDKIAEILVNELANQQAIAISEGKDPDKYKGRVFTDRYEPLDQFKKNKTPLANIFESDDSTKLGSTATSGKTQDMVTVFIDCYGIGSAKQTASGHTPADLDATNSCRNFSDLVRRILSADINENLQLDRKVVNSVIITSGQLFIPDFNARQLEPVMAKRLTLQCNVIDQPMVNNGVPLESVIIDIEKSDSGEVYATAEYDYT